MSEILRPREEVLRQEAFQPAPYEITIQDFEIYGPETLFTMTGAARWIQKHRLPRVGKLDMQSTADLLGIPLAFDGEMVGHGCMEGLPPNKHNMPLKMKINLRDREDEQRMTFGHEVGHAFLGLSLGYGFEGRHSDVEEFCEMFGFHYVLPHTEVLKQLHTVNEQTLLEIHQEYGQDIQRLIYFFIDEGLLPERLYVDSIIDFGKRKGELHRDIVCKPCRVDFGSCNGQEPPQTVLDFSNQTLGGRFSVCKNDDGSGRPRTLHKETLDILRELPKANWDEPF